MYDQEDKYRKALFSRIMRHRKNVDFVTFIVNRLVDAIGIQPLLYTFTPALLLLGMLSPSPPFSRNKSPQSAQ
jgi:ribonucleotide reductase beta subunit family protein with ferritin-like domain